MTAQEIEVQWAIVDALGRIAQALENMPVERLTQAQENAAAELMNLRKP